MRGPRLVLKSLWEPDVVAVDGRVGAGGVPSGDTLWIPTPWIRVSLVFDFDLFPMGQFPEECHAMPRTAMGDITHARQITESIATVQLDSPKPISRQLLIK